MKLNNAIFKTLKLQTYAKYGHTYIFLQRDWMTCMIKGAIIFLYFLLVVTKFIDLLFGSGSRTKRNVIENKVRNNKKKFKGQFNSKF